MRQLDIPKRGGGYSKARLLAAMGFSAPLPVNVQDIWQPLMDAPKVAQKSGSSLKTIGRLFDGNHRDRSLVNRLYFGPRKRVIFPFELEAWMISEPPEFVRDAGLIHPSLRGESAPSKAKRPKTNDSSKAEPQSLVAHMFMPPKEAG